MGRQPSDWGESNRRLAALLGRSPGDAELWYLLALGHGNFDDFGVAVRDLQRALAIDPGFSAASSSLWLMLRYAGRFDEATGRGRDRASPGTRRRWSASRTSQRMQSERASARRWKRTARQAIAVSTRSGGDTRGSPTRSPRSAGPPSPCARPCAWPTRSPSTCPR